jgi:hypothetical protein
MLFCRELLCDLGQRCGIDTALDWKTIESRVESEGLSFLTITLTNFGAALEQGLDRGFVAPDMFPGFRFHAGLPVFLRGFLELIFNPVSGSLLNSPNSEAVYAVRQLTLAFGKILLDTTDRRKAAALARFVQCENEMVDFRDRYEGSPQQGEFRKSCEILYSELFRRLNRKVEAKEVVPRHGPGLVADGVTSNQKYNFRSWPSRLELHAPLMDYAVASSSFFKEGAEINLIEPGAEPPVKVVTVPKTLKTPRIIAIEPSWMQYMQQGVRSLIYDGVEQIPYLFHMIRFRDQEPNQLLARKGSLYGELATLDLREASDRVSKMLVLDMLRHYPALRGLVLACRSERASVLGHGIIPLSKFASMGSALCFPFEAMAFLAMVFVGISRKLNEPVTHVLIKRYMRKVRVFGDDIVVPTDTVPFVLKSLHDFGQVVNTAKSFWTGSFRESCGKEYFNGDDVSIARVRRVFPATRRHALELVSTVSLRNQHYVLGNWGVVRYLDKLIEGIIPFPAASPNFEGLGKATYLPLEDVAFDRYLQRPTRFAARTVSRSPEDHLSGHGALLKFFLKGDGIRPDAKHLVRAGRPRATYIKTSWLVD